MTEFCQGCDAPMIHTKTVSEDAGVIINIQVWTCPKCILKG